MNDQAAPRPKPAAPRRRVVLITSVLAALASATVFSLLAFNVSEDRTVVLVAAVPLGLGQVVTAADVSEARIAADDVEPLAAIEAERIDAIIGQTMAIPLSEGALITADVLGQTRQPSAGRVETTVLAPDGRWPAGLQPGQAVAVLAPDPDGQIWRADATVSAVDRPEAGGALITLNLAESDAAGLAAADAAAVLIVVTSPIATLAPPDQDTDQNGEGQD